MTRDEAINIEKKRMAKISKAIIDGDYDEVYPASTIDALIELGLLKVDEPKSIYDRLTKVLKYEIHTASGLICWLDTFGLKVVEK